MPFSFLQAEFPALFDAANKAANLAYADPRTACFYARRGLEMAVAWMFRNDPTLRAPYQDHLGALVHDPSFKQTVGPAVFAKAQLLIGLGNRAVHSPAPVSANDAVSAVRELFHVGFWLARTYGRRSRPPADLSFDPSRLPKTAPVPPQTAAQLAELDGRLREADAKLAAAADEKARLALAHDELASKNAALDDELARLRRELALAKQAAQAEPDAHDYDEAQTRELFIDLLLREAGWKLDDPRDREFPVEGMPSASGEGFVDYVLWGDDGKPLGIVEAKRTRRDAQAGQQQAKLYADCLERRFGQRPIVFYSNGYEHWLWDDAQYPPRPVQGFYAKDELERLVRQREARTPLADAAIDTGIVGRFYQTRAIRRVAESFERDHERKALLVMATGAGKTRTVIALCELLMRCHWVKRVLFLADRVALVNQAIKAFKVHLPASSPVNLVTEKHGEGRVFVSTYPTMMGLLERRAAPSWRVIEPCRRPESERNPIDETRDGKRLFGVGHFDLLVIDEAHRSVFHKYRAIFDYFDALLVGLTATPKDEIDRNTYGLFDLETGVPTDAYSLTEAVRDGFLVPPQAVSVPLKFQRHGITYDELSEAEKEEWEQQDWDDEGLVPDRVEAEAINRWLFNKDTVDKVLEHLMTHGLKVAGGDRLGKTIVFARNQEHAEFIRERFDAHYPKLAGHFARVITVRVDYAQSLIEKFGEREKDPHIAISVDMLDTGIDVPEVVNLVFFKPVRSKTKFWQMLGRGTRLCPELFGPGVDKTCFFVFDFCGNLEFFGQNPEAAEGALPPSLGKRLFTARLELLRELDRDAAASDEAPIDPSAEPRHPRDLRHAVADVLHGEVAAMNVDNFVVRPQRRLVETFAKREAWNELDGEALAELASAVAGLPTELPSEAEEAKRFDLLLLNLQLALLRAEPSFARLRSQVVGIASLLEEKSSIPAVRAQLELCEELQSEAWWQDVTVTMLERVRRRLRTLVRLIEKRQRKTLYTDFEDQVGPSEVVALPGLEEAGFARFRLKARAFLRAHQDHVAIHKLRMNRPLTATDLGELERMLVESGTGSAAEIAAAKAEKQSLGVFVRSLVGLDREAAKEAFAGFLAGKTMSANQIEFVNLLIDHLTEHGDMDPGLLYESPFTDVSASGPSGMFSDAQVQELLAVIEGVRERAMG